MSTDDSTSLNDDTPGLPPPGQHDQDEADKYQRQADADAARGHDLLHSPRYDEFFAAYHPNFRESFVHYYLLRRQRWVADGEQAAHRSADLNPMRKEAYVALWAIQQKKLFDLQCQWRAEVVSAVPGVVICQDFETLSLGIENSLALPPITPAEFALYMEWARQADYERDFDDLHDHRMGWQKYRLVREALAPDAPAAGERAEPVTQAVPAWYAFHNQHSGQGHLLYLPDVRGTKEARYWDAWRAGEREQADLQAAAGTLPDPRPQHLNTDEKETLAADFAQRFEPAHLNRQRELALVFTPPVTDEQRKLRFMLDHLQIVPELVPVDVPPGTDWRVAIRQAYQAFRHRKLLDYLPQVYEEYQQNQAWGIAHRSRFEWERLKYDLAPLYRGWLLDGRKRLGEPEDFDF